MTTPTRSIPRLAPFLAAVLGLLVVTEAPAKGAKGGHSSGGHARAPHASVPHYNAPKPRAPKMPHTATPARVNPAARPKAPRTSAPRTANRPSPNATTRGSTHTVRRYAGTSRARRSYGRRYYGRGYASSQQLNRRVVARLRSVHAGLARLNHDYQGHRVRAMHAITSAIRQLGHRSMIYQGTGFAPVAGRNLNVNANVNGNRNGLGNGRRVQPLTQAQSDARMRQAGRTLQGVDRELAGYGTNAGHARARGHVQRAFREIGTALSIR